MSDTPTTTQPAADTSQPGQAPEIEIPTDAAGLQARDAELTQLFEQAPQEYNHSHKQYGREHLAIRKALGADDVDAGDQDVDDADPEADYSTDTAAEEPAAKAHAAVDDDQDEPREADLSIPDSAEAMIDAVVDRHEWAQDDPLVAQFAEFAHTQGSPQAVVDVGLAFVERMRDERLKADADENKSTKARLRAEWGDHYPTHVATIKNVLSDMPGHFGTALQEARLTDGSRLINHPDFTRAMLSMSRQRGSMPDATAEENELVALMKTDIDAFNYKAWRATGKTADQRLYELRKGRGGRR